MKKTTIKISLILIGAAVIFFAIYYVRNQIKASEEDSTMEIRYDTLELSRNELCLKEGFRYDLRLEPKDPSSASREYSAENFREALKGKTEWASSEKEVATVDADGVVTGCKPGETDIHVRLKGKDYICNVKVLSRGEDKEIPIQYNNDIFTKELYEQIDRMYVLPAAGSEAAEVTDKYGRSFIYSMMAGWNLVSDEAVSSDDMLTGPGGVILDLKNGKSVDITAVGGTKFRYRGNEYQYQYGKETAWGSACDFSDELTSFARQIMKQEAGNQDSSSQKDEVLGMKFDEMELNRTNLHLKKGLQYKLRLEADRSRNAMEYTEDSYQEVMLHQTRWKTSDKAVVTVDDYGLVSAVGPGKAVVTVEINGRTLSCSVQVRSGSEDEAVPIKYNNDLFTKKLYGRIKKIEVKQDGGTRTSEAYEISGKFGVSWIYSMLAECSFIEQEGDVLPEWQRSGMEVVLYLKNGEKICIERGGSLGVFGYKGKMYSYSYAGSDNYGQGFDFLYDLGWSSTVCLGKM